MTTVVLVHGAWHGPWCWDPVVSELDGAGVAHHAVDLPLTGHLDDVAAVVAALNSIDGPKVVVGHSYGGLVVSGAAGGRGDVDHLVYLCAYLLEEGGTIIDYYLGDPEPPKVLEAMRSDDDGRSSIDPAGAVAAFYGECPEADAAAAISRLRPMDADSLTHVCLGEPWREIPTTYVVCERDGAISADSQRRMAARAATILTLDTDHSPFLSRTRETVGILTGVL